MRILIVAEARLGSGDSGAERVLDGHVGGLVGRGHEVIVMCAAGGPRRDDGVVVREIGWSALTPWRARAAARDALKPGGVDAILLHHPLPGCLLLAPARRARIRTVALLLSPWHEEYDVRHPGAGARRRVLGAARRRLERSVFSRVDQVCAMSRFMVDRAAAVHGLSPSSIHVIPGGVDRARFAPAFDRGALRRRLDLPGGAPVLFCLRNLEPRMGVDVLLEAMPAVLLRHPDVILVIGGRGPLAEALRARAETLHLGGAVRFMGFVPEEDLPAFYAAADVSILPSQRLEGFGLVTLESLACGTPVLGTRVGATPELLEPLDRALLVDPPTADAFARSIVAFLGRTDREQLAARCRAHTEAYTWDHVAERLERELAAPSGR